ncbi:MAG: rhomboid family intramembrane serine protease [Verrucomicrobia bacterium]|nr:rhomboid family intramembrane serine protease [Verrucomicrobiota bacterium]
MPPVIRSLIWALVIGGFLTLFFASFQKTYYLVYPLLGLSKEGLTHFFLWQPFTFLFVAPAPLSFGLAIHYFIQIYLLRTFGTAIVQRVGSAPFLCFFLLVGALAGTLAALLPIKGILLGSSCAVYALLVAWTLYNPRSHIFLFLVIPLQTRHLLAILLGLSLLLDCASGAYLHGIANLFGALLGYLYAWIKWDLPSLFPKKSSKIINADFRPFKEKNGR